MSTKTLAATQRRSQTLQQLSYVLRDNPLTLVASCLLLLMVLAAVAGPYVIPYGPLQTNQNAALQAPSAAHWFGTDDLGRDVFSRVVAATRLDLLVSSSAVALSFMIGSAVGALGGYYGGWFDAVSGRVIDTIMAFPLFVLAMGIVAAAGNTIANVVYATAVINVPFYARLIRAEVASRRTAGFVQAARLSGNRDLRILALQIVPNAMPPAMVQISLNLGWAILNAAGLSFIGLGVRPPTPEWGIMVAQGANFILSGQWWLAIFPGLALMLAVFTFNLMGDGLRDLVDPRRRT